jgi:hypothetical protein
MEWCCKVFQGWFQEAGKRGLGVFAKGRTESTASFILQFRALDQGKTGPAYSESLMSLVSDVHIQFCPWCGANLRSKYAGSLRELDRSELAVGPDLTCLKR